MNHSLVLNQLHIISDSMNDLNFLVKLLSQNVNLQVLLGSEIEELTDKPEIDNGEKSKAEMAFDSLIEHGVDPRQLIFNHQFKTHRPFYKVIKVENSLR